MKITSAHREDNPFRKELVRNLVAYNDKHGPLEHWKYVGFYAHDDEGNLIGGVQGNFEWDWLHISHLWVKESGKGLGKKLMKEIEAYAKENKKTGIFLDTFAFQAKPFYEKIGYKIFGTIEKAAALHTRYFLAKRIG